ncbi:TPA: FAD-dependent oxidoreductase [Escherichia coli]|nr:FAD-dependent oxidoreductase [Escherichia coli]
MKYDLIIIGSGSVGAAAGYYATRAGLNVLMTDAHMPPHQHGNHHGDTRLIRHAYGEGEKYVPLVLRAQTLWDELSRHNEEDPIFVRSGVINLGPADSTFLANVAHSAEQWQLNVVLPGIGCCLYGAACTYDNSPDEDFIIDTLPGHDNTLLITGLSGHGFKFASVLGEIAADFAQDKKSDFDLTPFRLSRFQ